MNLPVQPDAGTVDSGAFRRRVSVTESGAQSANFACHPGDSSLHISLHISLTSTDGTVGTVGTVSAVQLTRDAVCQLPMTLGAGADGGMSAPTAGLSAHDTHPGPTRHRLHVGRFHRNAPIWDSAAEPWR